MVRFCVCPLSSKMLRNAKARKLFGAIGLTSNVSHLAKTLQAVQNLSDEERDMVLGMTERTLISSVDELWNALHVVMNLPLLSGGAFSLAYVSWSKALQYIAKNSPCYRELLKALHGARPCTRAAPYTLVLYADETIPGNIINLDYPRKSLVMRGCIKELGPSILKIGVAWIPLIIIRTVICKTIDGGGAAVWTALLHQLFLVEKIADDGIVLDLGDEVVTFFFRMGNFMLDGDAIRIMFGSKGGRPKMPCIGCVNVTSDPALVRDGMVDLCSYDASAFVISTDADLWRKADALEAASAGSKALLKRLETAYGMNYAPRAFLWCRPLRHFIHPAQSLTFDPMHIVLSQGMADDEYEHLLPRLAEADITWEDMHRFCNADWKIPKCFGSVSRICEAFGTSKHTHWINNHSFALGAAVHLMLMPIFLHFLLTIAVKMRPGRLDKEIDSFQTLSVVVALLKDGKIGSADAGRLQRACEAHGKAFHRAYPDSTSKKAKPHWLFHVPLQLERDGWILDCFVGERSHTVFKQCAQTVSNLRIFESSVGKRLLAHNMACLENPDVFRDRLLKPKPSMQLGGPAAPAMVWEGCLFARDDIVVIGDTFFVIGVCSELAGELHLVASSLDIVEQVTPSAARCRKNISLHRFSLRGASLRFAAAWYWTDADHALVILM